MARPRTFDEAAVLDAAASEFRVYGYDDTSTEQLCEAAGVRRSSLYNAFESKNHLYERALERYIETTGSAHESVLTDTRLSGADRLDALLELIIDEERAATTEDHAAGCMVVGARMTPGLGARSVRVQTLLDQALERQLTLLSDVVRLGRLDGSVKADLVATDAARAVVTLISGLRVLSQAGATPDELRRVAMLMLDGLRA